MLDLLKPKEVEFTTPEGEKKTYILSKFDAWSGREICTQHPLTALPKLGDYPRNEELTQKLMGFVGVKVGDSILRLSNRDLVRNHVESWETLVELEWAMLEYNISFFANGKLSTFLKGLAQNLPAKIIETLMALSVQSSQKEKQPLTNSEPSMT